MAATVVCKSCGTCFMFYCMFYFTCDRFFTRDCWLRLSRRSRNEWRVLVHFIVLRTSIVLVIDPHTTKRGTRLGWVVPHGQVESRTRGASYSRARAGALLSTCLSTSVISHAALLIYYVPLVKKPFERAQWVGSQMLLLLSAATSCMDRLLRRG